MPPLRSAASTADRVRRPTARSRGLSADQARVHCIPESEVIEKIMLTEPAVKRLVEPAEVAYLAVLLCGPSMSFANGGSYPLDGGWTAR